MKHYFPFLVNFDKKREHVGEGCSQWLHSVWIFYCLTKYFKSKILLIQWNSKPDSAWYLIHKERTWAKGTIGCYGQAGIVYFVPDVNQEENIAYSRKH